MDAPSELNFELSQQAPMAPRVGLCCRSESEGIDIPLLRKIDAAVSQNDHGFGIVAKNGPFRPEEKMFAQGKPLQLIDSEEFIKRLSQLPAEQQEEIAALRETTAPTRRVVSEGLEAQLYEAIPVLDHGFVRVVDYMGDDGAIVQAARVSYGQGTKKVNDDSGLIRYLMRHWHSTPFEMCLKP